MKMGARTSSWVKHYWHLSISSEALLCSRCSSLQSKWRVLSQFLSGRLNNIFACIAFWLQVHVSTCMLQRKNRKKNIIPVMLCVEVHAQIILYVLPGATWCKQRYCEPGLSTSVLTIIRDGCAKCVLWKFLCCAGLIELQLFLLRKYST